MIIKDNDYKLCSFIHCVKSMLKNEIGLNFKFEFLIDLLEDDMKYEYLEFDYDPNNSSMDTSPREHVFDLLSQKLLGHPWPSYKDKLDVDLFEKNLKEASKTYLVLQHLNNYINNCEKT